MRGRVMLSLITGAVCASLFLVAGCSPAEGPIEPAFDEGPETEAAERALRDLGVPMHDGLTVLMKRLEPDASWTYEQVLDDPYDGVVEWHRREYESGGWTFVAEEPASDQRLTRLEFLLPEAPATSSVVVRGMDDGRTTVKVTVRKDTDAN